MKHPDQFTFNEDDPKNWFFESGYMASKADTELFRKWTATLPERDPDMPFHCGPPAVNKLRMAYEIARPTTILEIGFNLGHTAMIWLNLGVHYLTSVDISDHPKTLAGVKAVQNYAMPGYFTFVRCDSKDITLPIALQQHCKPDLIFIDGGHDFEHVCNDIELGLRMGAKWFFLDDYDQHHGPGTQPAIAHHRLIPVALFPNMVLCVRPDDWELHR